MPSISIMRAKAAKEALKGQTAASKPPRKRAKLAPSPPEIEDAPLFTRSQAEDVRTRLLDWYDHNHRVLPWRRNQWSKLATVGEPEESGVSLEMPQQQFMYGIWVSEVMSQQTQVPRAAAYFKRWIAKWPTVQDLAKASMEEVNEVWAGLGYYRRARFLLEGANYVMKEMGGVFPATSLELQKIPGVGLYTGAAMASIAAGESVAVVDANVMRILARLRCLDWEVKSVKQYSTVAQKLVDPNRPGDFNQAVMELGGTLCSIHGEPACGRCPISMHCLAFQRQEAQAEHSGQPGRLVKVTDFPIKAEKAKRRDEVAAVCAVRLHHLPSGEQHYLLVKRPENGLLAGLWEMPLQLVDGDASKEGDTQVLDSYLGKSLQLPLAGGELEVVERKQLGSVSHTFSHIQLTLRVQLLVIQGDLALDRQEEDAELGLPSRKWVSVEQIETEGLSSSVRKVLKLVNDASSKQKKSIKRFFQPK